MPFKPVMETQIIGNKRFINAMKLAPKQVRNEVYIAMKKQLVKVVEYAQDHHRFKPDSGDLEKAIYSEFDEATLAGEVGVDDGLAVYGKWIHDGFNMDDKGEGGWQPDPFVDNALSVKKRAIQMAVGRAVSKALKNAGLDNK